MHSNDDEDKGRNERGRLETGISAMEFALSAVAADDSYE
jgi:hypothetical protein